MVVVAGFAGPGLTDYLLTIFLVYKLCLQK